MLGKYKTPDAENVRKIIKAMDEAYDPQANERRKQQFTDLKNLANQDDDKLLIAGAALIFDAIYNEPYKYPEGTPLTAGSTVYKKLKEALGITNENPLDDDTRFHLYSHIQNQPEDKVSSFMRASAEAAAAKAKPNLDPKRLQRIFTRPPAYESLMREFAQLKKDYEEDCKNDSTVSKMFAMIGIGGHAPSRIDNLNVLQVLNQEYKGENLHPDSETAKQLNYLMRMGALEGLAWNIANSYVIRSPENSRLYTRIQRILNKKHLPPAECDEIKRDGSKVQAYISEIISSPPQVHLWSKNGVTKSSLEEMRGQFAQMLSSIKDPNQAVVSNPRVEALIDEACKTTANTIAQGGLAIGVAEALTYAVNHTNVFTLMNMATVQNATLFLGLIYAGQWGARQVSSAFASRTAPYLKKLLKAPVDVTCAAKSYFFQPEPQPQVSADLSEDDWTLIRDLYHSKDSVVSKEEKELLELLFTKEQLAKVPAMDLSQRIRRLL